MTSTKQGDVTTASAEDSIAMESVNRISKIPVVESTIQTATTLYEKVKDYNTVTHWTLSTAENTVQKAIEVGKPIACPVVHSLEGPIKKVDELICTGIDYVESKVPALKLPPGEIILQIYNSTKDYIDQNVTPKVQNAYSTVEPTIQTAKTIVEPAIQAAYNAVEPVVETAKNVVEPVVQSAKNVVEPYVQSAYNIVEPIVEPAVSAVNEFLHPKEGTDAPSESEQPIQSGRQPVQSSKQQTQTSKHPIECAECQEKSTPKASDLSTLQ